MIGLVVAAVVVVGALAFLLSRGEETVTAEDYATGVCDAVGEYFEDFAPIQDDLASLDPSDPEGAQEEVLDAFGELEERTDQLVGEMEDAGVPDTEGGGEVADALVSSFSELRDGLGEVREDVEQLDPDDDEFTADSAEIFTDFQSRLDDIADPFEEIDDDELQEEFEENDRCQELDA